MKCCKNCRYRTNIHEREDKIWCRKHKEEKDENDLCEQHKRRK